jgi:hypothetical protein
MSAVSEPVKASFTEVMRALPKVAPHCHVEGAMRPGTVAGLARMPHGT